MEAFLDLVKDLYGGELKNKLLDDYLDSYVCNFYVMDLLWNEVAANGWGSSCSSWLLDMSSLTNRFRLWITVASIDLSWSPPKFRKLSSSPAHLFKPGKRLNVVLLNLFLFQQGLQKPSSWRLWCQRGSGEMAATFGDPSTSRPHFKIAWTFFDQLAFVRWQRENKKTKLSLLLLLLKLKRPKIIANQNEARPWDFFSEFPNYFPILHSNGLATKGQSKEQKSWKEATDLTEEFCQPENDSSSLTSKGFQLARRRQTRASS